MLEQDHTGDGILDRAIKLERVLESLPDPSAIISSTGNILHGNSGWERLASSLALESATFMESGKEFGRLVKRFAEEKKLEEFKDLLSGRRSSLNFELNLFEVPEGRGFSLFVSRVALQDQPIFLAVVKDGTEINNLRCLLKEIIYRDNLTGLENENSFNLYLSGRIHRAMNAGSSLFVLYIEIGNIKEITAMFGKRISNSLIVRICKRLRENLGGREFFRVQHDAFAAVFESIDRGILYLELSSLIGKLEKKIICENLELVPDILAGVCEFPVDGRNVDDILSNCLGALFRAKRENLKWSFYS
ncbi:MAG TPA: GGDEF domain-containing protein [Mesotoga sp.]|jgi:diguanylate cyclase (GGDEF)-like protein|nr:GGDEF domain-containing protein [Mesotoga sp.]MDI9374637.1 GGDEF domain-containing protein [Thermotogota bacterium]NLX33361.1 GGDEF domain-containing protein [Thermotogaceae bacterium]HOI63006.1 GGDEF domain-containing protein [Mesotoga sp.]HPB63502.1 GGDEF domain-containing protein [Mesotoga sp.]